MKNFFVRRRLFRLFLWLRKFTRKLAIALAAAALVSGIATYTALTGTGSSLVSQNAVIFLLNLDLILLILLFIIVARRIVRMWTQKKGEGSRLHVRMVMLFALVAATPTILVATFSVMFFQTGLQTWFSEQVRTAVGDSLVVAESYLKEHRQLIAGDAFIVSNILEKRWGYFSSNKNKLDATLEDLVLNRGINEAIIFDGKGQVIAQAGYTFSLQFEEVPFWAIERANNGDVAILTGGDDDRVRALVKLEGVERVFLYIGRFVDASVIAHIDRAKKAVSKFEKLEGKRNELEITFSLIFIVVALLILLASVWFGLMLATLITRPVTALIEAAGQVTQGNLEAKVEEFAFADELSVLSRAFNKMTNELGIQRSKLIETNLELDERSRFTETVLAGVSAGVIALDAKGKISIANRSALEFLGWESVDKFKGKTLKVISEEFIEAFKTVKESPDKAFQQEITLNINNRIRTFLMRLAAEYVEDKIFGYILTFDDITDLLAAQRKAAWSDVARRIAHEIKNPLTPIQLSAERLKRKYLKDIKDDPETFTVCTDTIIRHVGDIGRMVDEFSSFARMPNPKMKETNISEVILNVVMLQKTAYQDITFKTDFPKDNVKITCDGQLVTQMVTNLVKNSIEAISGREPPEKGKLKKGKIEVSLEKKEGEVKLIVKDNGKGFPEDKKIEELTEPYITAKSGGTGLGLAIVKKVMEDHGGNLILEKVKSGGAKVTAVFSAE